jgi:hypothetical protein
VPFRPSSVVADPALQPALDELERRSRARKQPDQPIWKSFELAISRIKGDGQWGEVIPPASIPRSLAEKFGLRNLYCVDLAAFHRLFYTVRDRDVIVVAIVDHHEYDRLMRA